MPTGDADRIRRYLCQRVKEARQAGEVRVTLRAGDVHRALGLVNAYPNVCQVLEGEKFHSQATVEIVRYVYRPPSGRGANLTIEFRVLPKATEKLDERYVTSGAAQLWSAVSGTGVPLLMFNGGPGCDDYLGPVAEMIDDLCRVIRFEPRGCGRSDWDGNYDIDTLLGDADAVRREYGAETCIVAGHSFGPGAALAYALRHPSRVIGLIGISGGNVLNDRTWSEAYHKQLEEVGEDLGGHEYKADSAVNPDGNRAWREYIKRPTLLREIADLHMPATFINGGKDIRPNWPTEQLASLMPKGRYIEIPDAAHMIWLTHASDLRHELRSAIRRIVQDSMERVGNQRRQGRSRAGAA